MSTILQELQLEIERLRAENADMLRLTENMKRRIIRLERDKQYSAITAENIERMRDFNAKEKETQHLYNELLLDNCPDMILVFDRAFQFLLATKVSSAFLLYSSYNDFAEKSLEHVFAKRFPAEAIADLRQKCEAVLADGAAVEYTTKLPEENGALDLTITASPAKNLDGDLMGVVIVLHDVTDLTRLKEEAENSSVAKSIFLATMSHEMRTPMNAIIGMSSIAKNTNDMEKMRYCMDKIDNASIHLLGVINDVLDISKIESGKFELSSTRFSFEKMLSKVVGVQGFRVDEKKQKLHIQLDPNLPHCIVSDELRLAQVVTNLLSNAVKFTPESGEITLAARQVAESDTGVQLEISVADNGIGMSDEQMALLFQSFQQADAGIARRFGGTGLGLVISKNIVEMMGGHIDVQSKPDHGSRFTFTIWAEKCAQDEHPLAHIQLADGESIRILAVDDSHEVLEFFENIGNNMRVTCDIAASGEEALSLIAKAEKPYHVVFVDWLMPGMNGIELTQRIRELYGDSMVVVMISASEWSRIEDEATQAGVDRFIAKPLFTSNIIDCLSECGAGDATDSVRTMPEKPNFKGKHILLAEDVELNREIVIELLRDTEITISSAENGQEAITKFARHPERYDLIFMDIHMPAVDGYEATRRIRAMDTPRAKTVPIVAMTANVFREDVERCLESGMNDHIGKPIDYDDMLAKLVRYL